ncbi:hypothetical protein M0R45_002340 [Rubus argutus]|uniref:DC1 domain-containing protein n=1 Tax=Rubus argutus TaxID=59490 RepID=A0AAW1VHK4_RUBAR
MVAWDPSAPVMPFIAVQHHQMKKSRCVDHVSFSTNDVLSYPDECFTPLHAHQLALLFRVPNSIDGVFKCHVCQMLSQGFAYTCSACDIYLDLQCSTMMLSLDSVKLTHDAHPHPLFFNAEATVSGCHGCHIYIHKFLFSCIDCDFNFCIACVKLPLTTRHIYDDHPLKLTCTAVLVLNTDGTPKMINIIVKYAKENEIHMMCSTTAQIVTLTAILIASWERPILK